MKSQIERSAYHEAGHILLTYLADYRCDEVVLNADNDGNAYTRQNYGDDLLLITAITNSKTNPEIFNNLPKEIKKRTPAVAQKTTNILLAGSIAESIFLNNGKIDSTMTVEISGPDLIRVENIDFLLSQIKRDHDPDFIKNKSSELFELFVLDEFKNASDELAIAIFAGENYTLNREEIETILTNNGYLNFISKFK